MNVFDASYMLERIAKDLMYNYFKIETFEPETKEKANLFTVTKIVATEAQNLAQQQKTENEYTARDNTVTYACLTLEFAYRCYFAQILDIGAELQANVSLLIEKGFVLDVVLLDAIKIRLENMAAVEQGWFSARLINKLLCHIDELKEGIK